MIDSASNSPHAAMPSGGNVNVNADASGVSWSAVIAGTAASAALSLILVMLGVGFGIAAVSPWVGAGAAAIGIGAIIWLAFTHVVAAGMGGYLAGRLRVRWAGVHVDEVYFRDTVHGFLTWCLATLLTAALMGTALATLAGAASQPAAGALAQGGDGVGYHVDRLFRSDDDGVEPADDTTRAVAARVLTATLTDDELSAEDRDHLVGLIARHTNLSTADAQRRVEEIHGQFTEATTELRAAAAWTVGWMFIALLMGAFFASLAATYGGRHRDSDLRG